MSPQLETLSPGYVYVCVWICLCGAQMGLYEEYWSSSLLYKGAEGMKNRLWRRDVCIFINTNTQKSFYLFGSLFQTLLLWVFTVCATLHANRGEKTVHFNRDWFQVFFSPLLLGLLVTRAMRSRASRSSSSLLCFSSLSSCSRNFSWERVSLVWL